MLLHLVLLLNIDEGDLVEEFADIEEDGPCILMQNLVFEEALVRVGVLNYVNDSLQVKLDLELIAVISL